MNNWLLMSVRPQSVCWGVTADDMGDPAALPGLLDQIDGLFEVF